MLNRFSLTPSMRKFGLIQNNKLSSTRCGSIRINEDDITGILAQEPEIGGSNTGYAALFSHNVYR